MTSVRQPIRWVHRNPDDDVERSAQELLRTARAETAGDAPPSVRERMWFRIASATEERPRRGWLVPAAAIACLLLVGLAVELVARPGPSARARVVALAGRVRIEEAGRWQRARQQQELSLPARLHVAAGARTSIVLERRTRVAVLGPAELSLGEDAVTLVVGETVSTVEPGHGRFEVELGRYRVVVRGTEFWSARQGGEAAVCLVHGAVDVLAGDVRVARLAPGQGWRSSESAPAFPTDQPCAAHGGAPASPPHVAPVAAVVPAAGGDGSGSEPPGSSGAPARLSPEGPSAAVPERAFTSARVVPEETTIQEPAPARPLDSPGLRATDDGGVVESPRDTSSTFVPLPERAPSAELAPAPAPPEPAEQPRRAVDRCREAPDRERCYREVADGVDLTAQSALYRLGELRRDRGDRQGALEAWLEYRRRFGAGPYAEESDLAVLEMRLRVGSPLARVAADRFLRQWPASPYLAEVRGIRGLLRHRGGDCAGALEDYSEALGARISGARRDESLYGRAACLDALGRTGDARAAYERYLQDLPRGRFAEQARAALGRTP